MDSQIKKGLIDICVLAVLTKGDSYGWQIIKDLENIITISESTLYPVLKRLETGGQIKSYEVPHNGRLRKYFKILGSGLDKLQGFEQDQKTLMRIYSFVQSATQKKEENNDKAEISGQSEETDE
ncbi:MAG: PadR family transcriptional regulator [Firmicutes bacterium]|nr:PadR family transcriptional regulator [Bacillota bacterium]